MRNFVLLLGSVCTAAGCASTASSYSSANAEPAARAVMIDARGQQVGTAIFRWEPEGVRVELEMEGLPAGEHGLHIHERGTCEPPDFASAGGHLNPAGTSHGLASPAPHAGDLPNLRVDAAGRAEYFTVTPRVTLAPDQSHSLFHAGGTALVVHAGPDDQVTNPSGDSGARIACGIIVAAGA